MEMEVKGKKYMEIYYRKLKQVLQSLIKGIVEKKKYRDARRSFHESVILYGLHNKLNDKKMSLTKKSIVICYLERNTQIICVQFLS